jgi:hypothetical protein
MLKATTSGEPPRKLATATCSVGTSPIGFPESRGAPGFPET